MFFQTAEEAIFAAFGKGFICLYTPTGQSRTIRVRVAGCDLTPLAAQIKPVDVDCFNDLILNTTSLGEDVAPEMVGEKCYCLRIKGEELKQLRVTGEIYGEVYSGQPQSLKEQA